MLDIDRIEEIAVTVARAHVPVAGLERVVAEPMTDSTGVDALQVTIVLAPGAVKRMLGDAALDLLAGLQQKLQTAGEDRFAFVEYATEDELRSEAAASEETNDVEP